METPERRWLGSLEGSFKHQPPRPFAFASAEQAVRTVTATAGDAETAAKRPVSEGAAKARHVSPRDFVHTG